MPVDYFQKSEKYKPCEVKTLLVGEAPPSNETTYFYVPRPMSNDSPIEDDHSLSATIFYHYFQERPATEERYRALLTKLKDMGIFLMDIIDEPRIIGNNRRNLNFLIGQIPYFRGKMTERGVRVDDENIIFLLLSGRPGYEDRLEEEFPNSKKIRWVHFRLN